MFYSQLTVTKITLLQLFVKFNNKVPFSYQKFAVSVWFQASAAKQIRAAVFWVITQWAMLILYPWRWNW